MATRLNYTLPLARHLLRTTARRLQPGGLAASLTEPNGREQFVIVSGPGRSGTSAVARALHESGVSMGTAFDPPSDQNRVGFYEDTAVRALNERIVGELGLSDVERSSRWPWRSAVLAVAGRYRSEMETVAATAQDGWKDPLFSITLEAWLPYLPHRPKLIVCLRSPEAYVHSVTRIYGLVSRNAVEGWWVQELRRLLDVMRDYRLPTTTVEYDRLVQHPEEVVAEVADFVGRPLDAQYIRPELRRFAYAVQRRHRALYDEVLALGPAGQRHPAAPADDEQAIDAYLQRVRAAEERLAAAKAEWSAEVGAPDFKLGRYEALGLERATLVEEARVASSAYVDALSEVQAELGSIAPPPRLDRYHELTRAAVDRERLTAQLMLQATDGTEAERRWLDEVTRAWRLGSSPEAVAEAQAERERARS